LALSNGSLTFNSMLEYRDYLIVPIQTSPGRWRAEISRADGRKIKMLVTGSERHSFTTEGTEAFSAKGAIERAKEAIDGGAMS
jgi:hypothetical protein